VTDTGSRAYRAAGVDLAAGAAAVDLIKNLADGVGGFAGLYPLDDRRFLAAGTDGVGTKLEVARLAGRLDTVGIDLVAMCANDVVCTGAQPLFFLDYLAAAKVIPEEVATIVGGVAEGCRRAGCALLGGETAEHPRTMEDGRFDLAGFCVGLVDRDNLLDPEAVEPGDELVGFPSTGLHSNGFSLVRRVLLDGKDPSTLNRHDPRLGRTLGEELLEPTAMYVRPLLALARAGLARSAAHITGGGMGENLPRAIPPGLGCELDVEAWTRPPVFDLVAEAAGLPPNELFTVLNMGIGMVVVAPGGTGEEAVREARAAGTDAVVIGRVVEGGGVAFR
jgi:phosphoribosylformylglycinamidine cyclo-ligase